MYQEKIEARLVLVREEIRSERGQLEWHAKQFPIEMKSILKQLTKAPDPDRVFHPRISRLTSPAAAFDSGAKRLRELQAEEIFLANLIA